MADRDLKRLSRADLVDIIYEQQKQLEALQLKVLQLEELQKNRSVCMESAGSIAEAALQLNDVFAAAQAAADQYLTSVQSASAESEQKITQAEQQAGNILAEANCRAAAIQREAEDYARQTIDAANREAANAWSDFRKKADEFILLHSELNALMAREV